MAQAPAPAAEAVVPASKSKKMLIIGIVVAVLAIGGGVAAYLMLQHKPAAGAKHEEAKEEAKAPVFVPLETFTVNLQADPDEQYLQVDMTLQVSEEKDTEIIKLHMPELRNRILLLLSSKKSSEVASMEGKQMLSDEIIKQVKLPFAGSKNTQKLTGVFFTSFVIQ